MNIGSDVHWRAKKEGKRKKTGGRRPGDWEQISILKVSNVTTFSFVLTGNISAIVTKGKKKWGERVYYEGKNIV